MTHINEQKPIGIVGQFSCIPSEHKHVNVYSLYIDIARIKMKKEWENYGGGDYDEVISKVNSTEIEGQIDVSVQWKEQV